MGDMGDTFRDMKEHRRMLREKYGIPCPNCLKKYPKGNPTIMLPQQKCKVCGYVDPRERIKQ